MQSGSVGTLLASYAEEAPPTCRAWDRAPAQALGHASSYHAWLTGSSGPIVTPGRSGPGLVVRADSETVLVDCGAGVSERLSHLGIGIGDVDVLLLTHLHIDHVVELAWLILSPLVPPRHAPLKIAGPSGTITFVNRILAAFNYDLLVRRPMGFDPDHVVPQVLELDDGQVVSGRNWQATTIEVEHQPVHQAFGFRFDLGGRSLVVSGDTRPCPRILEASQDADVLVHEAIWPGWGFPEYHTLPDDVGRLARDANVGHLVLTHMIPSSLPDEVWLQAVGQHFSGRCTVGSDLLPLLD